MERWRKRREQPHTSLRLFSSWETKTASQKMICLQRAKERLSQEGLFSLCDLGLMERPMQMPWSLWQGRTEEAREKGVVGNVCIPLPTDPRRGVHQKNPRGCVSLILTPTTKRFCLKLHAMTHPPTCTLSVCQWAAQGACAGQNEHFMYPGGKKWAEVVREVTGNMAASRDHQHTAASMSPFMAQRCHALPHGIQVGTAPRSVHPTPLSWPYPAPGLCHGSAKVGFKRGPGSSDVGINVSCPFWALRLAPVHTSRCLGLQGLCPASKNSEEQQRVTSSPNSQMLLQIC